MSDETTFMLDSRWDYLRWLLGLWYDEQRRETSTEAQRADLELEYQARVQRLAALQRQTELREASGAAVSYESLVQAMGVQDPRLAGRTAATTSRL